MNALKKPTLLTLSEQLNPNAKCEQWVLEAIRRLERERDEAVAEAERLRAYHRSRENERLRVKLAILVERCAAFQSRTDKMANELDSIAEKQRTACANWFLLKASSGNDEGYDLCRSTPLITVKKKPVNDIDETPAILSEP